MDFRQTFQPSSNRPERAGAANNNSTAAAKKPAVGNASSILQSNVLLNVLSLLVILGAILLILATALFFMKPTIKTDAAFVATDKYQAVFLNNGQVYFGKIDKLTTQSVNLSDVFYLTQSATQNGQASSDYTLVKLGCQQIHHPDDRMLINREQVTFWENISKEGKVAKSIEEFKKQNPNGENCKEATETQNPASGLPSQSSNDASESTSPAANPSGNQPAQQSTNNSNNR